MAGQQDTLREQWRIAIIGAGGVGLLLLLVEKFVLDQIAPESPWVSIPVMAAIITLGIAMIRYWIIMRSYAAKAKHRPERAMADALRQRLEQGGGAGEIYEKALTRCLNAVDRFFGDDGPAVKTLWPRAFGFEGKEGQKPFWTAPAYDRCLLIAFLYPLLAMMIIWTVTGEVGPGEKAIRLGAGVQAWRRWVVLICLAISGISFYASVKVERLRLRVIFSVIAVAFSLASTSAGANFVGGVVAAAGAGLGSVALFGAVSGAGTVTVTVGLAIGFIASFGFTFALGFAVTVTLAVAIVNNIVNKRDWQGLFLLLFTLNFLLLCYVFAYRLSGTLYLERNGAIILFLGVLTLVNAPFDWLTIGLTRALLRRGLELRRWWPLALAGLDLVLAAAIIVLLAIAMLLAVQAFEYLGGTPILGVEKVLNDLADPEMRTHPEYWWLYATLFSTLIPSIINVAIGALSIMRGSGGFHRFVAAKMPTGQAILVVDAIWIVPLLALEVLGSVVIGVALTLGWIWVVVAKLFPLFGGLIPMLRAVAGLG